MNEIVFFICIGIMFLLPIIGLILNQYYSNKAQQKMKNLYRPPIQLSPEEKTRKDVDDWYRSREKSYLSRL